MSKDRAAPFSRKHRRYWLPVTGGMILIGVINVTIGLCSYKDAPEPQRLVLHIDAGTSDVAGTIGARDLPIPVMRAFTLKHPQTIPTGARKDGDTYTIGFGAGHTVTFQSDGSVVSEH